MNRFWVIGNSKKVLFPGKSVFVFLLSYFCTLFLKTAFCYSTTFFESLITHKRFVFKESYISYAERQKSCTLIVIWVKCLYLTSPIFNSSAKSNRLFLFQTRKYITKLKVIVKAEYKLGSGGWQIQRETIHYVVELQRVSQMCYFSVSKKGTKERERVLKPTTRKQKTLYMKKQMEGQRYLSTQSPSPFFLSIVGRQELLQWKYQ